MIEFGMSISGFNTFISFSGTRWYRLQNETVGFESAACLLGDLGQVN